MFEAVEYEPQWASPPGGTILDVLDELGMSIEEFCIAMRTTERKANKLIAGDIAIDHETAQKLGSILGGTVEFWLKRDEQYRSALIQNNPDLNSNLKDWLSSLPLKDMMDYGWIEKKPRRSVKVDEILDFFNVCSPLEWHDHYSSTVSSTVYRTSVAFESKLGSVSAWLRQGEILASKIPCQSWDKGQLINLIPSLRTMTRIKEPAEFVPKLQSAFASCGVALVIVRAPAGCRASGATRFLSKTKAMIQLSFRYRTDDHFWFTLFHEIAHLILHEEASIFIETTEYASSKEEVEANNFAQNVLIHPEHFDDLHKIAADHRKIMRFAKKIGISHGIVVGQMQHMKIIPVTKFNSLKTRYTWV